MMKVSIRQESGNVTLERRDNAEITQIGVSTGVTSQVAKVFKEEGLVTRLGIAGPAGIEVGKDRTFERISTTHNLQHSVTYLADTSVAPFSATLPVNPEEGHWVEVWDAAGTFTTSPVTILRNGNTIAGLAEDFVFNRDGRGIALVFSGGDWQIFETTALAIAGDYDFGQFDIQLDEVNGLLLNGKIDPALLPDLEQRTYFYTGDVIPPPAPAGAPAQYVLWQFTTDGKILRWAEDGA